MLYEEVTRMPPFKRKTLVLVGVQGVGRRTLKNRLINSDQTKFASIIPRKSTISLFFSETCTKCFWIIDTSRPPRVLEENGKNYWFIDREDMEEEIRNNHFLEHGEHNGNLYGTHLDSVRDVIKQGNNTNSGYFNSFSGLTAIFDVFNRENVCLGLCAKCIENASQQHRIHAICHIYCGTWNGTIEAIVLGTKN